MSETVKKKVIEVDTGSAVKNVNDLTSSFTPLSRQIKELKNQLAQLEQGTEEYNRVAKQLADTQQRQIEVTEAAKYANKDFGQTLSNVAAVSAGVVGAINGVSAVMTMLGADSEKAQEAMKNIQLTMAVVQGLGAMDTAVKAIRGLNIAFAANTVAVKENTTAKVANAAATGTMNTANTKGIGILGKLVTAFKTTKAAMGIWVIVITAAVAVIAALVKKHKEEQEALRQTKAEIDRFRDGASSASVEVVAKYRILQKSFVDTKAKGESLTKWVKEHKGQLKELNMENMTMNQLDQAFIERSEEYIEALKARYTAQWKLKVVEQDYINYLKAEADLQAAMRKSKDGGVPNSQKEKLTIFKDGEYVTKTYEEWLKIRNDARYAMESTADEFDKATEELNAADAALSAFGSTVSKTTSSSTRSLKELRDEFLELWKTVVSLKFDNSSLNNTFSAYYKEAKNYILKLRKLLRQSKIGGELSDNFRQILKGYKGEFEKIMPWQVTVDFVFNEESTKKLTRELEEEEWKLQEYIDGTVKVSEAELETQKKKVAKLQEEVKVRGEILETVKKIAEINEDNEKRDIEKKNLQEDLVISEEYFKEYFKAITKNDPFAEIDKSIREGEFNLSRLNKELSRHKERLSEIKAAYEDTNGEVEKTKKELERLKTLPQTPFNLKQIEKTEEKLAALERGYVTAIDKEEREILTVRKDIQDQSQELEFEYQNRRLLQLQQFYDEEQAMATEQATQLEIIRTERGGGVADYNTALDLLKIQMQTFENQKRNIERFYDDAIAMAGENKELATQLEMEKQAALTQIDKEAAQTRLDIMKEESNRKLNIAKAYYSAYQNLSSCIGDILQAEMDKYDENSEKYKELQVANAWINTLSGTLGAFMSGINSGIPAPYNLILAAAMAATTFTAGALQIANIENDARTNAMTSGATNVASEYEVTAYQTQSDVVSSVGEQRVTVLESDISTTQNRVAVREANAAY